MSSAMAGLNASGSSSGLLARHDSRLALSWADWPWWQAYLDSLAGRILKKKKWNPGTPGIDYPIIAEVYLVEELAIVIPQGGAPGIIHADVRPLRVVPATADSLQEAIPLALVRSAEAIGVELEWGSQVWDEVWQHLPIKSYKRISRKAEMVHVEEMKGELWITRYRGVDVKGVDGFFASNSEPRVPVENRDQLGETVLAVLRELRAERPRPAS